jgi:hypothetical protein
MMENRILAQNVLIAACAISTGVHLALAPVHGHESAAMGAMFSLAAGLLITVAALVSTGAKASRSVTAGAAVLLTGLIGAYGMSRTVGLPFEGGGVERVDLIGVSTQVVQLIGLGAALSLLREELDT